MMDFDGKDDFLEERLQKYASWISEGKIPTSSRVIPIHESLNSLQWVLPTNQVIEILRNARSYALQSCSCRTRYKRCNKPLDVCFLLNDAADQAVIKGNAKYIKLDEAIERLKLANQSGLVHLTIYNPEQHIFALCSCCDCCCHDIQIMKKYKRTDFIAHSDYIVTVDTAKCINCGECVNRCVFGAQVNKVAVEYHQEYCYGCGLCVTTCPTNAISLIKR
jgi:NAD-dependent dihydropyrimidine dehydrogenase PreA subunit